MSDVTKVKNWLKSKTIVGNATILIALGFVAASKIFEVDLGTDAQDVDTSVIFTGGLVAVFNFINRFFTNSAITVE